MPPVPCCALPNPDKFPVNPEASVSHDEITKSGVSAVLTHSKTHSLIIALLDQHLTSLPGSTF